MLTLNSPLENCSGVGQAISSRMKRLGILTVNDLSYHFPFRYLDFRTQVLIKDLQPEQDVNVQGTILKISNRKTKQGSLTEIEISDQTGTLKAVWFNQPYLSKTFQEADQISLAGKLQTNHWGTQMSAPLYEKIRPNQKLWHTNRLLPVYTTSSGVSQKQIRSLLQQISNLIKNKPEWIPAEFTPDLISHPQALWQIHFPNNQTEIKNAQTRLKFEELLLLQLHNYQTRQELKKTSAPQLNPLTDELKKLVKTLPFDLTTAQRKTSWQIIKDCQRKTPMNRLLEGDVGAGKTIVACLALLNAIENGYQAALLVPTTLLAQQHYLSITKIFAKYSFGQGIYTRTDRRLKLNNQPEQSLSQAKFQHLLQAGQPQLVIGTHALLQTKVKFKNLALVIVDEQHRFGVKQRQTLKEKSGLPKLTPHFLSMTATPIPRSLALTLYGDLDLSILDQLPPNRQQIITKLTTPKTIDDVYRHIRQEAAAGRQAFIICPLIEESDHFNVKAATSEQQRLQTDIFPDLKVGLLHGRLKEKEKEQIQVDFQAGKFPILVATSVVEVGIDIPQATIILIEGAERFGLAQLHQFRGRVGRSNHQSYCYLQGNPASWRRLNQLVTNHDGFSLAEADLKERGSGQVFGKQQSGQVGFKLASWHDQTLIQQSNTLTAKLYKTDPSLKTWPQLSTKIQSLNLIKHLE